MCIFARFKKNFKKENLQYFLDGGGVSFVFSIIKWVYGG